MHTYSVLVAIVAIFVLQASGGAAPPAQVARGKEVYQNLCASCHGGELKKPGPLGPEMFGASRALLEAKVLRGAYPSGYKPKRPTQIMVRMPHLERDIPALESYLNAR